jgi:hypothetical protein
VEQATCAVVQIGDRCVTLALSVDQLAARGEGDLITAEIISVDTIPHSQSA